MVGLQLLHACFQCLPAACGASRTQQRSLPPCPPSPVPPVLCPLQRTAFNLWYMYDEYNRQARFPFGDPCCLSCNLVRQYAAASFLAQYTFHRDMGRQMREELDAHDEGRPFRLVVLPTFEVKVPEAARHLDPLETCSACRKLVEAVGALLAAGCCWLLLAAGCCWLLAAAGAPEGSSPPFTF